MTDSEKLKPAFESAADLLLKALHKEEVDEVAKLAIATISSYSKLKATERAHQTLQYLVIKDYANENGDELRRMVKSTLPELAPKAKELVGI